MQVSDVQRLFLRQHGIRIEPEMAHYIIQRLPGGSAALATPVGGGPIPIMGADARTGLPMRQMIDLSGLDETMPL